MAWIWKQQIEYDNLTTGLSYIKRSTDWQSPGSIKQCIDTSLSQITNYDEPIGSSRYIYAVPDINGDYEPDSIWNNLDEVKTVSGSTYDYASILSINRNPTTKIFDTPNIVTWDYNFNIPTGATITGIQVKINKSAYGIHDQTYIPGNIYGTGIWDTIDQGYFNTNMTHYTYDKLVTLSDNSGCTSTFDNYAKPYTKEILNPIVSLSSPTGRPIPPKGIWEQTETTHIYGGDGFSWVIPRDLSLHYTTPIFTWTPEKINNNEFSLIIGATQHVYRGYGVTNHFHGSASAIAFYNDLYFLYTYYDDDCRGYQVSKIHDVQIKIYYDELTESQSYNLIDRTEIFTSGNTLKIDDSYFKFQRCFNGICYNYVRGLNDIYELSLMSGDGKSTNNMYNEYNIIDEYIPNLYSVDVATSVNVDLTINHFILDGIKLKPNHLVLLLNQNSGETNDIYTVDRNYYLVNSNLLSTREKSYRAKVYVKLGSHYQEQWFLNNVGNQFPIVGESKIFTSGHSYMIKNYVNYDIFNTVTSITYDISGNTVSNPSKILFTNYKVARSLSEIVDWDYFDFNPTSSVTISYLDNDYTISSQYNTVVYTMSGSSSAETIFNWSGNTYFVIDNDFSGKSLISDHILISIKMSGETDFYDNEVLPNGSTLNYLTTIKNMNSNYLIVDEIPDWILNEISIDSYRFRVRNLHFCSGTTSNFTDYLNVSPYGEILDFLDIYNDIRVSTKNSDYYRYFDFNNIILTNKISGSTTAYTFTSNSQYQDYTLVSFLNKLGSYPINMYNDANILSGDYTIEEIYVNYNDGHTLSGNYYPIQSSRYKIIPSNTNVLSDFKPYTYVDIGILSKLLGDIYTPYSFTNPDITRTLITEITDEYMLVEKPRIDALSGFSTGVYDIVNVSKVSDISDILYQLYLEYPHSYYYKYSENIYNKICSEYALILKDNAFARNLSSGILYQKNDLFNLDIFNLNIDADYNHIDDVNLTYVPIELIDIGIDKKTKLPIPLDIKNIAITVVENLWYTGTTYSGLASS